MRAPVRCTIWLDKMNALDRAIRLFVYEHFARTGMSPSRESIAGANDCTDDDAALSLGRLETEHHALALAPTTGNIWMAHPFSAVPTPFAVESADVRYWANCAWDAVTIPSLVTLDASVAARCAETGDPMELTFERGELVAGGQGVVHFVVPPRRFWENVGYT